MKRALQVMLSAAVLMGAAAVPASAADPARIMFAQSRLFDQNTMQGWQRTAGTSAMAYGTLKFHPTKSDASPARFGFAVTAPMRMAGAGVLPRTQAPRFVDLGFTTRGFDQSWGGSLNIGGARAWTYDPYAPVGEQHSNFLDSGTSWIVVGLATVALGVAVFSMTENGT